MADRGTAFGPASSQILKSNYIQDINLKKEMLEKSMRGFGSGFIDETISIYQSAQHSELSYSGSQVFNFAKALQERKGWASVIAYLYGQEINKNITSKEFNQVVASLQEYEKTKEIIAFNSLPADAPTPEVVLDKNLIALTMFDVNHFPKDDSKLAEKIAVLDPKANESIRDGAEQVTADFKAQENTKAISEFNALQELALKESDPAVKNLIKQAADLKLAGYTK
ncbi:hypothetical protein IV02_04665 [Pseudomonas syringae]|uniref:Uncharacterized protein n=2 Tax=Pseudomonas syringae TaxID=317 RepID=A0A085VF30_PSESX|nr:hypothetical protein IV02_04665 [Pseudomonas syringae]